MTAARIRTALSDELGPELFDRLTALCAAARGAAFDAAWDDVGPGLHVLAEEGGRVVGHAMIVDRSAFVGHEADQAIDVGYVERVAVLPSVRGRGVDTAVMDEIGRIIGQEYTLGALSTQDQPAFAAAGWTAWLGPTLVRTADGQLVRSAESDGTVMVLRTHRTPAGLDPAGPIAIEWRPGEPW